MCLDLEIACDEQVVRRYSLEERKAYSNALLSCGVGSRPVSACPIAFGEVDVKERIMKILNYRKPAFWVCIVCVLAVVGTAAFFLTDAAPRYNTVLEEYASMVGLQKNDFLDKVDVKEEDLTYEFRMYHLPEAVIFNETEFTVMFSASESTMDRVGGVTFQKTGYENIEALAEDLVAIEQALFEAYGTTHNEMPIFTDKQQVVDAYENKTPIAGVSWQMDDTAPYVAAQEYMDEMLTWEHIIEIAEDRWGSDVTPRATFIASISPGQDHNGIYLEIKFGVSLSCKGSWEE